MASRTRQLPTIEREVREVTAERDVRYVEGDGIGAKYVVGETTYTARTANGDFIEIAKAEFDRLSAALAGDGADR